jgi:hypothetical protein
LRHLRVFVAIGKGHAGFEYALTLPPLMKPPLCTGTGLNLGQSRLASVVMGIGLLVTSLGARAQLVQLHYVGTVRSATPGENWFAPGELVLGQTPVRLDISYFPDLVGHTNGVDPVKIYHPEDDAHGRAADYTYRIRFGTVDLTRELSFLGVNQFETAYLEGESFGLGHELSFFSRIDPPGPDFPLPTTLPSDINQLKIIGGADVVITGDLPNFPRIDPGVLLADLTSVTLTREFTPVPEPSVFGVVAAAMLAGLIVLRRRV